MFPSLSQTWPFFTNLGQNLSQEVSFFVLFEPILRAGFLDKMLALLNKKYTFVSGFLIVVSSKFCRNIILKVTFSLNWHFKVTVPDFVD